ncbi:hypothetical protein TBLA_0J01845 [Henningerozyma blattae CBS 6284]|uniref:Uncharacterized protein n=1 Tax=Henningerozyma blattae (strain ATCC 34711 / CBS 6284 / DSM 70876 / NBRC 10599 / NRRL Y-10934 / UCD 77-7) TaxID=1071380 RepID=I2H9X7_HENB6|nr:hypothetical protein TBLA_0J01845 [Tetrapisispora blattae CBS 6284]CCH63179.1 hypothetical protein TBLA_0J01845 [Tetrapisispora blattae CBS 6284]
MSFAKIAAIIAAAAAIAKADREAAMISMEVYMNDIGSHMKDYLSMEKAHPEQSIPPGVLSAYAAKLTDKTDSYTSFFADIGDEQIHYMITGVPWYSTRLAPAISQALEAAGLGEAAPATSSSKAVETTSSKAVETTSSKAVETTSSKAVETTSSKAVETSSSKAVETSSSKAVETSSSKAVETSSSKAVETSSSKAVRNLFLPRLLKPLPRLKNLPRPLKPLPRLNLLLLLQMLRPPKLLLMLSLKSLMVKFKLPLNNKLKTVLLELLPV